MARIDMFDNSDLTQEDLDRENAYWAQLGAIQDAEAADIAESEDIDADTTEAEIEAIAARYSTMH